MIEKIIDFSVRNRFLVIFVTSVLVLASLIAVKNTSLDALPDLSPPQVILEVKWSGQSPEIIESQIVYPLISNLLSLPDIETVRAMSSFSNALVYVIFKDNVDIYESRNRILEELTTITATFPSGATVKLGPDSSGVGWAYEYALKSDTKSLDELRTIQDYYYSYALLGVDGVSEVAAVGGFVKNYEITINQNRLIQYDITFKDIIKAVKKNNNDKGGRIILENGFERIIQSKGYIQDESYIENILVKEIDGVPIKVKNLANVNVVPANRRGMADLNGEGEVVGGIVVVRFGTNPYKVIKSIKEKLKTLKVDGIEVVETYDRTSLIDKAINTLSHTLLEESIIVIIIIAIFLFHFRSSIVVILVLPITVLISFLLMKIFDIGSNIMSLGGIAIAIGAMVDASIVMVENAHKHIHKHIDKYGEDSITLEKRTRIIVDAAKQVGRPIFFALVLIVVSFLPIFVLTGQEGKLFIPLAYTKTFAMIAGAILSITLVPILMIYFVKGKIKDESKNPINRFFQILYSPFLKLSLKFRYIVVSFFAISLLSIYPLYKSINWEFMPMMNEQTFMYMPVTSYGIGIDYTKELTNKTDMIIKSFPEVKRVFGKAGRADSATDPAPLAMIETIVTFKDKDEWRDGMTYSQLMKDMDDALQLPGLVNSWTYPIRGRIDMLLTGIRTPLGIKLYGDDRERLQEVSIEIENMLKELNSTLSVSSDKSNNGYYLDVITDNEMLSRYDITKNDILDTISYLVGGNVISEMIDGVQRYPISIRLDSEDRDSIYTIQDIQIKTKYGYFPLKTFASLKYTKGPSVIKSEKGLNVNFIYITPQHNISAKSYKEKAEMVIQNMKLPVGFYYEWAGQSQYLESAMDRFQLIIPITLIITFILIYFALKDGIDSLIVFFSLPFALIGGLTLVYMMDYNLSVAVVVGFLALIGVASETAIVMIIYINESVEDRFFNREEKMTKVGLKEAIYEGAVLRLRPKLMTVFAILGGLIPILFIEGVGSEVTRRIVTPMIGGMISSALLTLIIIPVLVYMKNIRKMNRGQ
jgi:Cu(I)/Ag(I) efflux system membrane protein CusA/SilA